MQAEADRMRRILDERVRNAMQKPLPTRKPMQIMENQMTMSGGSRIVWSFSLSMSKMLNKLGKGLRWLGEKVTSGASWLGSKVGGTLLSMSPALSMVSPGLGAGAASAGAVLRGVGALGDMGASALRGGRINPQAVRQAIGGIRSDAQGVKAAYNAVRGPGNPLERPR